MNKIKQELAEKPSLLKWIKLSTLNAIIFLIFLIIRDYCETHYTLLILNQIYFFTNLFLAIFFSMSLFVSMFFLFLELDFFETSKKINTFIKRFIIIILFLWLIYVMLLCILPIILSYLGNPNHLILLCLLYLDAVFPIWIYQFTYCVIFLKEHLLFKSTAAVIIKIAHSILISINGWFLILLNLFNFAKLAKPISIIYVIISSSTILFYPSLDMFEYMSKEVDKFNKKKKKERIENESNGSKNYTA